MSATGFERIDGGLYRRNGLIYARVREDGKRSWRGTGTNDLNASALTICNCGLQKGGGIC
jgi:hypothetical protein